VEPAEIMRTRGEVADAVLKECQAGAHEITTLDETGAVGIERRSATKGVSK